MKFRNVTTEVLLTPKDFDAYTRPGGKPVILRGWMDGWAASKTWTFEYFKTACGADNIRLAADSMGGGPRIDRTLAEYIDYITSESDDTDLHQAHRDMGATEPFYCTSYKPFGDHPELQDDFALPPFVIDWWPYLNSTFHDAHFPNVQGWVLISPKNAVSRIHVDSHHTITWLAQLQGRKLVYLFAPEDSEAVYEGKVDPVRPDYTAFPKLRDATCLKCELNPGDMLFLPPDWWHHVVTLENSITVSQNLVNHTNFGLYIRRAFGRNLPVFLQNLPPRGMFPQPDLGQASGADLAAGMDQL